MGNKKRAETPDERLLRTMIREVLEEDWKKKLAIGAMCAAGAAGCAGGMERQPMDPTAYSIGFDDSQPGQQDVEFDDDDADEGGPERPEQQQRLQFPSPHRGGKQRQTAMPGR